MSARPGDGDILDAVTTEPLQQQGIDEALRKFAESAAGLRPDETITPPIYASIRRQVTMPSGGGGGGGGSGGEVSAPPAVPLPELPYLAVELHPPSSARAKGSPSSDEERASAGGADFEVTGVLGEGGMGRVLLARQRSLRRDVAIKTLKFSEAPAEVVDTLVAEAVVTGSIEHPSVVPIYALGRDEGGKPLLVMKRIEGVSWRELTREPAHPAWASIGLDEGDRLDAHIEILMAVCNAAHFAHSRGVIHRDLKLDNVMIGAFGEVYLVDWGIAVRSPAAGEEGPGDAALVGTPTYMAPEMLEGDLARIDARTDVYLLGATLHAALTGAPRHRGESILDVLLSARDSPPFDYGPSIPAELGAICNRAMSRAPEDRFSTAIDLRRALASFRRHRGSIALSDQAAALLREVRALRGARSMGGPPADERLVHARMTECRFGFMQALRAWSENAAAREGLVDCVTEMIEHELERRDIEGARALYAELGAARPSLAPRIEALETELRDAALRDERLRAMERDLDLTLGARVQVALVGMLPVFAMVLVSVLFRYGLREPDRRELIVTPAVAFLLLLVALGFTRQRLRTRISRRAIRMFMLLPAGVLLHRVLSVIEGSPVAPIFMAELVLGAVVSAAMAISFNKPRMGWVTVVTVLGALAVAVRPEQSAEIFAVAAAAAFCVGLVAWLREGRL